MQNEDAPYSRIRGRVRDGNSSENFTTRGIEKWQFDIPLEDHGR